MAECTGKGPYIDPPEAPVRGKYDSYMSDTSENAVKNRIAKAYMDALYEELKDYVDEQIEELKIGIPDVYQKVEYIRSTDSATMYIDTGLTLDGAYRFFVDGKTGADGAAIFFDAYQDNNARQGGILYNRARPRYDYWWTGVEYNGFNPDFNIDYTKRFELRQDATGVSVIQGGGSAKAYYNGSTATGNAPILLFGSSNESKEASDTYIYDLEITKGSEFVRDFVPVVRKADNIAGLYDKVTDTFYASAGSAQLIAGPAIG